MVAGSEIPVTPNSLLLRLADVTVIDEPPAVRLPVSDELDPTTTLPKLRLPGDTASWPAAVTAPESAITSGELDASDTNERFPLAAPAPFGVNVAVNVTLPLGVSVRGTVNPLIEKAAPDKLACVMVTPDPPVLVKVSDRLPKLLACTLPNARLAGLGEIVPCEPAATALPEADSETRDCPFWFSKEIVTDGVPAAAGWNLTVKDADCPAASTSGGVTPVT